MLNRLHGFFNEVCAVWNDCLGLSSVLSSMKRCSSGWWWRNKPADCVREPQVTTGQRAAPHTPSKHSPVMLLLVVMVLLAGH